jgi:hypothetical protein
MASAIAYGALVRVLVGSGAIEAASVREALAAAVGEVSRGRGSDLSGVLRILDLYRTAAE